MMENVDVQDWKKRLVARGGAIQRLFSREAPKPIKTVPNCAVGVANPVMVQNQKALILSYYSEAEANAMVVFRTYRAAQFSHRGSTRFDYFDNNEYMPTGTFVVNNSQWLRSVASRDMEPDPIRRTNRIKHFVFKFPDQVAEVAAWKLEIEPVADDADERMMAIHRRLAQLSG